MANEFVDTCVFVFGERQCVEIYTKQAWDSLLEDFKSAPRPWTEDFEWLVRQKTRSFEEVEIKKNGRLMVPKTHIDYARLKGDRKILLHGMLSYVELWSQERFEIAEEQRRAQRMYGK
jgi:DNA-binding transcriptional regulator/RsmH inhibitor MraZ